MSDIGHNSAATPLLDTAADLSALRAFSPEQLAAARRGAAPRDDRRGEPHRRPSRCRARRDRADRGAASRVRHADRPPDLGRRPPGLSAQDPDRPPRPHPHPAPGRRPVRLHAPQRKRVRPVRCRAQLDLDLRGARHGGGARSQGRPQQRHRGDRRRRHERRHGLRGDEQRRLHGDAADRHPQRQRHVDRTARRCDERVPVASCSRRNRIAICAMSRATSPTGSRGRSRTPPSARRNSRAAW